MIFADQTTYKENTPQVHPKSNVRGIFGAFQKLKCKKCNHHLLTKSESGSMFKQFESYACAACGNVDKYCVAEY